MSVFLYTLFGNLIISISIITIIFFIKFFKKSIIKNIDFLTSITIGVILGVIFLGFFPEIFEENEINFDYFGIFILLGLLSFYFFELFLHWHHCRDLSHDNHHCHTHDSIEKEHMKGKLMFLGTFLHNSIHGIVLFSAFSISFEMGFIATVAILLHSIPQNISNYIMTNSKEKYYFIASFGGVFGALLTFPFRNFLIENEGYILLFISGGLLYTALTDIFPEIKNNENTKSKILYFLMLVFGIILFGVFNELVHSIGIGEH